MSFADPSHFGSRNLTLVELWDFYRTHENLGERGINDPSLNKDNLKQIERDINWTFPHSSYFYSGETKNP